MPTRHLNSRWVWAALVCLAVFPAYLPVVSHAQEPLSAGQTV